MRLFHSLALAAAVAMVAGQAAAGGLAAPIVEPAPVVVVEPEAPGKGWGIILPLALLGGLVAIALAQEEDEADGETPPGETP
jgi:hypothetical protein